MSTRNIVKVLSPSADVPEVYMFWERGQWHVSADGADEIFRFSGPEGLTAASAAFHTAKGTLVRVRMEMPGQKGTKALDLWFPHGGRPVLACFLDRCLPGYALAGLGPSRIARIGRWCLQAVETDGESVHGFRPEHREGEGPELSLWPDIGWNEVIPGTLYESSIIGSRRMPFCSFQEPHIEAEIVLPDRLCRIMAISAVPAED